MLGVWLTVIGLIIIGMLLLFIELFTPTLGIIGAVGVLLVGTACYVAVTELSFWYALIVCVSSGALVIGVIWWFFHSGLWRKFKLLHEQNRERGYHPEGKDLSGLMGKKGITVTKLRPSGAAIIDGVRVDVVTDGVFLEEEVSIKVVGIEGIKVRVKKSNDKTPGGA